MPWTVSDVDEHKEGLSTRQKRQWVAIANDALQRCLDRGGRQRNCEASAIRQANGTVGNNALPEEGACAYSAGVVPQENRYSVQSRMHQGRKHLVVPVVMMVEGVHHGSHGPLLHLGEELGRWPGAWNGIPVVVHHPMENGQGISANCPDVVEREVIGRVYNTHFDGNRLRGEAWLDEEKAGQVSPEALGYIKQGSPLDVSVGVFTDDEPTDGTWNGEEYVGIARNHRPDHLAFLPGAQGACSWADGCGVRANSERKGGERPLQRTKGTPQHQWNNADDAGLDGVQPPDGESKTSPTAIKALARQGIFVQANAQGYRELADIIQHKLDAMDTDVRVHFLEELFDDYFVYRVNVHGQGDGRRQTVLYKRGYTTNEDGAVEFGEEPTPVVRKVEYVEQTGAGNYSEGGDKDMGDKQTQQNKAGEPCCPEKVEMLIQSEHNNLKDADREWLSGLPEEGITRLEELDQAAANNKTDKGETAQMNKDEAVQVLKDELSDPEKFKGLVPGEIREQMEHGMKLHKEHRQKLVDHIVNNAAEGVYTKEELEAMDTGGLEKLAKVVKPKADYSGLGGGGDAHVQDNAAQGEVLLPIGVEEEKVAQ